MQHKLAPGFRFNNGKLMIFTEDEAKLVNTWPDLEAVRKPSHGGCWTPFAPCFRMLRPRIGATREGCDDSLGPADVPSRAVDPNFEKQRAFWNFRQSIPPETVSGGMDCLKFQNARCFSKFGSTAREGTSAGPRLSSQPSRVAPILGRNIRKHGANGVQHPPWEGFRTASRSGHVLTSFASSSVKVINFPLLKRKPGASLCCMKTKKAPARLRRKPRPERTCATVRVAADGSRRRL